MGVFNRIQSRLEIWRLERRYTRNRDRRTTFVSNARYVDGEYVYQTPVNTGSSYTSANSSNTHPDSPASYEAPVFTAASSSSSSSSPPPAPETAAETKRRKRLNRFSAMPGFGSSSSKDVLAPASNWRSQRNSFDGTGR